MGSSYSDEGRSRLKSRGLSTSGTQFSSKSILKDAKHRSKRLEKWRKAFQDIASQEKFEDNKYWNKILADLLNYTKKLPIDKDLEWIKDPQLGSLASITQYSKASAQGEIRLVGLESVSELESEQVQKSFENNSIVDPISKQRENIMKNSAMSVQFGQASNIFSSFQERPSLIPELRKTLLSQIEDPNHVIQGLINTFKLTCDKLFGNCISVLGTENYTKGHEEVLSSISGCCKRFISILTKFMSWIYKESLEVFEHNLEQESLSILYLIEDILYEILFKGPNSKLYSLAFHLLTLKYKLEQIKFREILAQKKTDSLSNYDEVFSASKDFLLETSSAPYNEAINKIKSLRTMTNPYTKYDITMSIEDEMWKCICQHYDHDAQMQSTLRHSFGMDFRLPIFTYCLIQTQCEDLVIHKRFIEEFLDVHILDYSFGFTVFKSSMEFLLQERGGRTLSGGDLQVLAMALSSKRNSLK